MRHDNGSAVTIGSYDGIHIGHRHVIALVRNRAADAGLQSVVVTFDKNPAAVVNPESAPPRLTDTELKIELLRGTGVDRILVLAFDEERAKETAEDFVTSVLVEELGARLVVVGDDFHFGNKRRGNVALLREMGAGAGFSVEPVHLVSDDWAHEVVSSTRIRALVAEGRLEQAGALLGRPHEVRGRVVGDDGERGLHLEVPSEILLPPPGEYAGSALSDSGTGLVPARIVVSRRGSKRPQLLELRAETGTLAALPEPEGRDRVVRARFG